ncbi:hypothetical protein MA16_Dca024130 [Dendrobium catenatum]|uniref:Uncharacterized protein n=1 Tax=Dendrobium catenatum TaxID=906689 RepID=A0A2I0WI75_9ASPA|nr:hypothetical protein MA16_Dca024130 [Dendrobium catenatum]
MRSLFSLKSSFVIVIRWSIMLGANRYMGSCVGSKALHGVSCVGSKALHGVLVG